MNRDEFESTFRRWLEAWNSRDLDGVIGLFRENAVFETWNGFRVVGREGIRRAWKAWFEEGGPFEFTVEDLFFDEGSQKAVFAWRYEGPSTGGRGGKGRETRRGVDLLWFDSGGIARKTTYTKTVIEIDGRRTVL